MTLTRRHLIAALSLPILAVTATRAEGNPMTLPTLAHYGGTVRFDPTTGLPYLIDDDAHAPVGLSDPVADPATGLLDVLYAPALAKIVTAYAIADETLATLDVAAGVSVGVDRLRIRFTRHGAPLNAATAFELRARNANIWLALSGIPLPE